jgi:hypothetical protein
MLLNAFFDKAVFVKFNITNNFEQNIDENNQKSIVKSISAYKIFKSQEKSKGSKSLETFAKSL